MTDINYIIKKDKCFIKQNDYTEETQIPHATSEDYYDIYYDSNAVDILYKILPRDLFFDKNNQILKEPDSLFARCKFAKVLDNAVAPYKSRQSDVGYDLTIVAVKKVINSKCTLYTTGICVQPEHGWYTEIVPRSSIIKSGYMLANSVGIIENSYRGELMIALTKVDEDAPPIELPFRCCQLIFKKQYHAKFEEVTIEDLSESNRGSGGFGSTNK